MSGTVFNAWAALGTGIVAGVLTEPDDPGYARQAVACVNQGGNQIAFPGATFGPAVASWGSLTEFALFDAATAGNMLFSEALAASPVAAGLLVTVPPGTYAMAPGSAPDADVLTVGGVPLTALGQPLVGA